MAPQLSLGMTSSYDFFFEILWPNYQEYTRAQNLRTSLNTAWSMWHIHDWKYYETNPAGDEKGRSAYAAHVISQCRELSLIKEIVNTAKHLVLKNGVKETSKVGTRMRGVFAIGVHSNIPHKVVTVATTTGVVDLSLLFYKAFLFWLDQVMPHPVNLPLPADGRASALSEDMLAWCRTNLGDERAKRWKWAYWGGSDDPAVARFSFYQQHDADTFRALWDAPV